jgi:hypothetical protein
MKGRQGQYLLPPKKHKMRAGTVEAGPVDISLEAK